MSKRLQLGCSARASKGEDRAMVTPDLLGVFDGHRCDAVAEFASTHFPGILARALQEEEEKEVGARVAVKSSPEGSPARPGLRR